MLARFDMATSAVETQAPSSSIEVELMRPRAFVSVAATERVALEQTHISWVFVLDHDVFKVKKPVDFGFLDFRALEQRRVACEAEVRLNRRLAPHVYFGVVPIRIDTDGHLKLGGWGGEAVDYAVHMARMPEDRRADHLLELGLLSTARISAIAKRVADFHAQATVVASEDALTSIETNLAENFEQTHDSLGRYLTPQQAGDVVGWQKAFVRDGFEMFRDRAATGRVREGHGDLRLEHVYFEDGSVTILDCIEFNERFRIADVAADVAFLSMDLAAHGRVDLAEKFLAAYARESNDFDLYSVVDFYESYRAFVRGKLAAMRASDATAGDAEREKMDAEARRYFLLALAAERRSLVAPSVVAVGGIIASGKSTVADRIGAALSAPVVEADRTRKSMLGVAATAPVHESAWHGAYDPAFTDRVYDEMIRRAAVVLESGRPVILDASFRSKPMRAAARALADRFHVPFRFVECVADPAVCRRRLKERELTGGVSDGRLEIFDDFCTRREAVVELPPTEHIRIDTTRPIEENLAPLRTRLGAWPAGLVA